MKCKHTEVAARSIIGEPGTTGSQAFCTACHATALHPGSPQAAMRYFRRAIREVP